MFMSSIITKRKTPDHFLDDCFREFKDAEPRTPRLLRQPPSVFLVVSTHPQKYWPTGMNHPNHPKYLRAGGGGRKVV